MGREEKIKLIIITAGISVASMLILYAIMRISGCNGNSPVRETVVIKDTIRFGGSEIIYKEIEPEIRKVKIASVFVVSDVLNEKRWDPQFDAKHVKQKLKKMIDIAVDCFSN